MSTVTVDLPLTAPANLRDLAGIPIAGGELRPGFAIRADDLSTIDEATASDLVDGGLAAVIDLRSHREVTFTGRGPLASLPVTFHHLPFITDVAEGAEDALDQAGYGTMYIRMFDSIAPRIVQALAIIATSTGATAFHCAAGQDRTGVLAASLLTVLGAERDDVVADYARTGENQTAIFSRLAPVMGPLMGDGGFDLDEAARRATAKRFSSVPLDSLFDHLESEHGGMLQALRAAGLGDGLVQALRKRAVA